MSIFISIVVVIIMIALYIFMKRKNKNDNIHKKNSIRSHMRRQNNDKKFHSVSLRFSVDSCKAAKKIQDKRFLPINAPRLPLPDCDVLKCECKFERHKDRRSNEFRRNPYGRNFGADELGQFEENRRKRRERRKD